VAPDGVPVSLAGIAEGLTCPITKQKYHRQEEPMLQIKRQQNVLDILKSFRGLDPLKQLFWSELNYTRLNQPLSGHGWADSTRNALAQDPIPFAGGGQDNDFHVIYARLDSDRLLLGPERPVVSRLLQDHPYAVFVFSNEA